MEKMSSSVQSWVEQHKLATVGQSHTLCSLFLLPRSVLAS
jgi:hypothetical protein